MKPKILVVDDDPDIVVMLCDRLEALGYQTVSAPDGQRALELVEQETPRLMLLDLEMPRVTGIDVLKRLAPLRKYGHDLPVIVMTAHGTIHAAVEAMKQGAYDFLTKPFDADYLEIVIEKALERESLTRQVASLQDDVASRYAHIIAKSASMTSVIALAQRAANSDAGVLLLGESGTGKELFARSVHQWSPRRSMPFVVINCVALTESLLENELFGHEKGAFTGADRLQKGKIEMADGGTVFLDEIGDMPMNLQASLLRVLQDHEFHRVGGVRMVRVNIRVIAATNKDLKQAVAAGTFREDLYFRLNVVTLTLPPLRERPDDLPALAEFFMKRYAAETKKPGLRLSPEALNALMSYGWPGNVRELQNVLERAAVLSEGKVIEAEDLALTSAVAPREGLADLDQPFHESVEGHKKRIIRQALARAGGSQTRAAEVLGLQRTYLARLIKQMGLKSAE
ncbi:MAG: sigma-54-dependent Fis family transcriptional regulator [Nitrospirae bacterium]|nr:sigma-54-dependent Fis family transcriptional regulator [Nitrospirota bacterium]